MTTYETPIVDGPPVERTWTMIAAELDGIVLPDAIGGRRLEREARFSQHADAALWLCAQELDGFTELHGPAPLATNYHGPSDSPSNAWVARASRELGSTIVTPARITFERDGKTHVAEVGEPVAPRPDAMIVEHDGRRYAIAIGLGVRLGDAPFVARPVLGEPR